MKNKNKVIKIHESDVVSCPIPNTDAWNLHPKVYINMKDKKSNSCPYCGTIFISE